jgi:DNA-binding response OmpR family regulator
MTDETIEARVLKQPPRRVEDVERQFLFGPFRLLPGQRLLFERDRPIPIGSRALDLLIALVENAGELMSKDELTSRSRIAGWGTTKI